MNYLIAFAEDAALLYGPDVVCRPRLERIRFLQDRIRSKPDGPMVRFMREMIESEEEDAAYAARSRIRLVEYKQHVSLSCGYWQNLRFRKFVSVNQKCQRCGGGNGFLEAHHLHYNTLGFEELRDLQALCSACHEIADRVRENHTRYNNAKYTYMEKKYGDGDYWSQSSDEEFDRWLDRKERNNW